MIYNRSVFRACFHFTPTTFNTTLEAMGYRVIKTIKGREYIYEQRSQREGGKVKTISRCIGPVDPIYFKGGRSKFNTTNKVKKGTRAVVQPSIFEGEFGGFRVSYQETQSGLICHVEQIGDNPEAGHITLHPSGALHRKGVCEKLSNKEALKMLNWATKKR
jgi:hypothetical protein